MPQHAADGERRPSHTQRRALLPRHSPPLTNSTATLNQSVPTPTEKTWDLAYKSNRSDPPLSTGAHGQKRRREQVSSACMRCQTRRIKCDGVRPSCQPCSARDLECKYSVPAGISRNQNLKQQVEGLSKQTETLELFVDILAQGTDFEASAALSRLRIGHSISDIVCSTSRPSSPSVTSIINIAEVPEQARHGSVSASSTFDGQREWLGRITEDLLETHLRNGPVESFLQPLFRRDQWLDGSKPPQIRRRRSLTQQSPASVSSRSSEALDSTHALDIDGSESNWSSSIQFDTSADAIRWDITSHIKLSPRFTNMTPPQSENHNGVPTWAIMTANNLEGLPCVNAAIREFLEQAEKFLDDGYSLQQITGTHPNIAALFDSGEFARASLLSRWAARMAWSLKLKSVDFTVFAIMYLVWHSARWMIDSRFETYNDVPQWLRPTPYQLLVPHVELFDFLIWPKLRDHVITTPSMQSNLGWLMEMSLTLSCSWGGTPQEALCRNPITGDVDLTDIAKDSVLALTSWSLGPSFRKHLLNADAYLKVYQEPFHQRD